MTRPHWLGWLRLPKLGVHPLVLLSVGILTSAIARGIDFLIAPIDGTVTMTAIGEWTSPYVLGVFLVALGLVAVVGLVYRSPPAQVVAHIALAAIYLVMGAVSFFPVITTLGWGWRAPVSYIFGSAVVHWYVAHSWFNRWVVRGGRTDLDP